MKKVILPVLIILLLWSCGGNKGTEGEMREGKGGVYYGGVFRMNETEDFRSLYPLNVTENVGLHIATNIYEGLVKLSQSDLSIIPCLAEKWNKSDDAKVWTFYLRKGVKFQNDPCFAEGKGRDVTANDFKYCFDKLCEAAVDNQQYGVTFKNRVEGANEYYQSTIDKKPLANGVPGIKVIDDYKLEITLKYPFAGFLNILTMPGCWVYPKEAIEKYGSDIRVNCVGTGPFQLKNLKEGDAVVLERNKNYWELDENGNQLPYLDALKTNFLKDKKSELYEFKKGNLEMMVRLPVEMIPNILDEFNHAKEGKARFDLKSVPAMGLDYYGFQDQSDVFKKKEVRQAFNYAINRENLVTYILLGDGIPATYGVVPPSFTGYDNKAVKGFSFKPDTAKKLMAKAGYPNGKGFPKITLEINSGGERNVQVAEAIQKMLKENLNVDIDINVMPMAEHMENFETGKALFWRTGWIADYPDPESFLTILYGKHVPEKMTERSYINTVRYKSARFDSLFELALRQLDPVKRFDLYRQADQVAIDDAAIMPIFYHENYRLVKLYVKNCETNAMEYRDFSRVYFTPRDENKKR